MLTHLPLLTIDLPTKAMYFYIQVKNATLIDMIQPRINKQNFSEFFEEQINEKVYILDIF